MFLRVLLLLLIAIQTQMRGAERVSTFGSKPDTSRLLSQRLEERKLLKLKQDRLEGKQDFWQNWALVLALIAAVTGVLAGAAQYLQSRRAYSLRSVGNEASEVDSALERLRQEDSAWEVANAQKLAGDATAVGQTARQKAEETSRENIVLQASLTKEVAASTQRAEELKSKNLTLEGNIEAEKLKRVSLAASLLPRSFSDQSGAIQQLSHLEKRTVAFAYVNEAEPRFSAEKIAFVLSVLRWPFYRVKVEDDLIRDGVSIDSGFAFSTSSPDDFFRSVEVRKRTDETKDGLVRVLQANGWDVTKSPGPISSNLPPDTIIISVGRKPNHELEKTLEELGRKEPTPLGSMLMRDNRQSIPLRAD